MKKATKSAENNIKEEVILLIEEQWKGGQGFSIS